MLAPSGLRGAGAEPLEPAQPDVALLRPVVVAAPGAAARAPWRLVTRLLASPREILVLGGTRFLGRAFVEQASGRGHDLTLFNRGEKPSCSPTSPARRAPRRPEQIEHLFVGHTPAVASLR